MGAPKQLAVLKSQFESPAYEGVSRAETGNARLLHVNLVRSWIRDIADSDSYNDPPDICRAPEISSIILVLNINNNRLYKILYF